MEAAAFLRDLMQGFMADSFHDSHVSIQHLDSCEDSSKQDMGLCAVSALESQFTGNEVRDMGGA